MLAPYAMLKVNIKRINEARLTILPVTRFFYNEKGLILTKLWTLERYLWNIPIFLYKI